ncbi:TPA: hypothetical protein EYO77_12255 [Candidatus Poribacteria bacterium]|nr:hypothetical protein [Candidatus Poribacteria bacterium]
MLTKLNINEFETLHTSVIPPKETWTKINWEIDFWKARRQAYQTGKPIFMWAMDGHPLGCT